MKFARPILLLLGICSCLLIGTFVHEKTLTPVDIPTVGGERCIVVVIPSYNNSRWYKRNIGSIFQQKYNNYRIVYIDDCSTDGTYDLVRQFVEESGQQHRVSLIRNSIRRGALYNLYTAIWSCPDWAIIVTLDGDDWVKHDRVLATINEAYADPNVWLTYGQYEEYPHGSLGICRPVPAAVIANRTYRTQPWVTSHLRTFYAGLFKLIKKEDLFYRGRFYEVTWDQAFMFPMLEMANGRIKFIDSILYVYNQANPLNDFKNLLNLQLHCERMIRDKERYAPLSNDQGFSTKEIV